jgi:hypothetical protein
MARGAAAIVAGLIAWVVVATVGNLLVRAAMGGYAEVEVAMAFTLGMLLLRLLVGAVASFCAGFVAAWISKRNGTAVKILAGVLLVFFLPVHYRLWDKFALWYHLTFLLSLVVVTMLGAMCYSRSALSPKPQPGAQ